MKTILTITMSTLAAVELFAGDEAEKLKVGQAQRVTPSATQPDAAAPRDPLTEKDKRIGEIPKPLGGPSEDGIYLGTEGALQQAYRGIAEADEAMQRPSPQVAQAKATSSAKKDK